jgi:hypothetical protein
LFPDKSRGLSISIAQDQPIEKVMSTTRSFFSKEKLQSLQMIVGFMPKPEILIGAVDNLNLNSVTEDRLQQLLKNWPTDEFESLLKEAEENPD